ncbi:MAG: manganese efflux pump [Bacilli bacterium]|jgi:putative Mn2+ efflux pump MntP
MNWLNIFLVAISMSADTMTVGATDGIREPDMPKWKILLIPFLFGVFQMGMPIIGYFIGYSFQKQLEAYIPWIAFSLLTLLAIKNIVEWAKDFKKNKTCDTSSMPIKRISIVEILTQSVATSIDALCIGFVYLDSTISEAMLIFGIIGIVTFVLSLITTILGKKIGCKLIRWAGLISGIVFLATGLKILLEGIL